MQNAEHRTTKRRTVLIGVVAGLLALTGAAYTLWKPGNLAANAAQQPTSAYQTSVVRRGSLSVSISGTGTLVAAQSMDLTFPVSGTVAQLNVKVGDTVKSGQVLATLNNTEQLQLAVDNAQLALQTAQQALDSYTGNPDVNLAQAFSNVANAEKALATAQANVRSKGETRCDPNVTEQYYEQYLTAQDKVDGWETQLNNPKSGYGEQYVLQQLIPLRRARDLAYVNYTYCQGFTQQEIDSSHANLQAAKANLQAAQVAYDALKGSNGLDQKVVALDQAAVKNELLQLTQARANLSGAKLISPIDGVITAINGSVGQPAGTDIFASVADLNNPELQVSIDETDLADFKVGCPVQVSFNSIPAKIFPGKVTQVLPVLTTSKNVTSAQGVISLENVIQQAGRVMPLGSSATVNITCSQADNVLEVPAEAVHQLSGQSAYVYILNTQGQPEKRTVTLGVSTSAFMEVRSGLNQGDRVITSGPNLK